jgi:hypothetical protein
MSNVIVAHRRLISRHLLKEEQTESAFEGAAQAFT